MKNYLFYSVLVLAFAGCTAFPSEEGASPVPVITFYKGSAYIGDLYKYIYSDTIVSGKTYEAVYAQVAAGGAIKSIKAANLDQVFMEENFEDEIHFNKEVYCAQPVKAKPYTQVYTFTVTDWQDQTVEKTLTIQYK